MTVTRSTHSRCWLSTGRERPAPVPGLLLAGRRRVARAHLLWSALRRGGAVRSRLLAARRHFRPVSPLGRARRFRPRFALRFVILLPLVAVAILVLVVYQLLAQSAEF